MIIPAPIASISSLGATRVCFGQSALLQFTGTGSYIWLLDSSSTGVSTPTYTAWTSGTYSVITTNGSCSVVSNEIEVEVVDFSSAIITRSGPTTFCAGDAVTLSVSGSSGESYIWRNGTTPVGTGLNYVATVGGDYTYEVITAPCAATSAPVHVTVNPLPAATITVTGNVMTTSSAYSSYQWARNGAAIVGANGFSYTAQSDGTYSVYVTDFNGCSGISSVDIETGLGVSSVSPESILVYPNPANRYVHIKSPIPVNVRIASMDGKIILTQQDAAILDLGQLPAGVYSIQISDHEDHCLKVERLVIAAQ
jgi:hypothetical protein